MRRSRAATHWPVRCDGLRPRPRPTRSVVGEQERLRHLRLRRVPTRGCVAAPTARVGIVNMIGVRRVFGRAGAAARRPAMKIRAGVQKSSMGVRREQEPVIRCPLAVRSTAAQDRDVGRRRGSGRHWAGNPAVRSRLRCLPAGASALQAAPSSSRCSVSFRRAGPSTARRAGHVEPTSLPGR
jgi:hypothetical protein